MPIKTRRLEPLKTCGGAIEWNDIPREKLSLGSVPSGRTKLRNLWCRLSPIRGGWLQAQ